MVSPYIVGFTQLAKPTNLPLGHTSVRGTGPLSPQYNRLGIHVYLPRPEDQDGNLPMVATTVYYGLRTGFGRGANYAYLRNTPQTKPHPVRTARRTPLGSRTAWQS